MTFESPTSKIKKAALLHDLSGFGKCSLTAAIPVLSVMGIQPCPLPTAILSAQTGFEHYFCEDFTDQMQQITEEWVKIGAVFDGIYTGFVSSERQIDRIFQFLDQFYQPDTLLLVDPVMGDDGTVFKMYDHTLKDKMQNLTLIADIITPNLTECCLLTGTDYHKLNDCSNSLDMLRYIEEAARLLQQNATNPSQRIVITGIHFWDHSGRRIGNLILENDETFLFSSPDNGVSYSGTGDLFASALFGYVLQGNSVSQSLPGITAFLEHSIQASELNQVPCREGVYFEHYLSELMK